MAEKMTGEKGKSEIQVETIVQVTVFNSDGTTNKARRRAMIWIINADEETVRDDDQIDAALGVLDPQLTELRERALALFPEYDKIMKNVNKRLGAPMPSSNSDKH